MAAAGKDERTLASLVLDVLGHAHENAHSDEKDVECGGGSPAFEKLVKLGEARSAKLKTKNKTSKNVFVSFPQELMLILRVTGVRWTKSRAVVGAPRWWVGFLLLLFNILLYAASFLDFTYFLRRLTLRRFEPMEFPLLLASLAFPLVHLRLWGFYRCPSPSTNSAVKNSGDGSKNSESTNDSENDKKPKPGRGTIVMGVESLTKNLKEWFDSERVSAIVGAMAGADTAMFGGGYVQLALSELHAINFEALFSREFGALPPGFGLSREMTIGTDPGESSRKLLKRRLSSPVESLRSGGGTASTYGNDNGKGKGRGNGNSNINSNSISNSDDVSRRLGRVGGGGAGQVAAASDMTRHLIEHHIEQVKRKKRIEASVRCDSGKSDTPLSIEDEVWYLRLRSEVLDYVDEGSDNGASGHREGSRFLTAVLSTACAAIALGYAWGYRFFFILASRAAEDSDGGSFEHPEWSPILPGTGNTSWIVVELFIAVMAVPRYLLAALAVVTIAQIMHLHLLELSELNAQLRSTVRANLVRGTVPPDVHATLALIAMREDFRRKDLSESQPSKMKVNKSAVKRLLWELVHLAGEPWMTGSEPPRCSCPPPSSPPAAAAEAVVAAAAEPILAEPKAAEPKAAEPIPEEPKADTAVAADGGADGGASADQSLPPPAPPIPPFNSSASSSSPSSSSSSSSPSSSSATASHQDRGCKCDNSKSWGGNNAGAAWSDLAAELFAHPQLLWERISQGSASPQATNEWTLYGDMMRDLLLGRAEFAPIGVRLAETDLPICDALVAVNLLGEIQRHHDVTSSKISTLLSIVASIAAAALLFSVIAIYRAPERYLPFLAVISLASLAVLFILINPIVSLNEQHSRILPLLLRGRPFHDDEMESANLQNYVQSVTSGITVLGFRPNVQMFVSTVVAVVTFVFAGVIDGAKDIFFATARGPGDED